MKPDLSDQYILITGSGRGLGRHAALHLASCGAIIGVADIDAGNAEQVAGEITSNGGKAKAYSGDMSDRKAFMAVAADFAKLGGRIDAIINNAMLLRYSPVQDVDEDTLSAMLDIGIKALFWSAQAMLTHYDKERGGHIINLASPVATRGFPNTSVYSTVKGAVTMFTKTMAAEFGPQEYSRQRRLPRFRAYTGLSGTQQQGRIRKTRRLDSPAPQRHRGRQLQRHRLPAKQGSEFCAWGNINVDGGVSACN